MKANDLTKTEDRKRCDYLRKLVKLTDCRREFAVDKMEEANNQLQRLSSNHSIKDSLRTRLVTKDSFNSRNPSKYQIAVIIEGDYLYAMILNVCCFNHPVTPAVEKLLATFFKYDKMHFVLADRVTMLIDEHTQLRKKMRMK